MRRAVIVLTLASCSPAKQHEPPAAIGSATSAPTRARRPPSLPSGAFTLAFADSSNTPAAWTAVADQAASELAACPRDCRDLAFEVVLARKKAAHAARLEPPPMGDGPVPVPREVAAMVDALDAYVETLDAADDDVAPNQFLAAASLWRYRQPDAVPRLEALLREHRDDATAEYAANQLLDMLMRENRIDELRAWAAELSADETFLANKPDLQFTLERVLALLAETP